MGGDPGETPAPRRPLGGQSPQEWLSRGWWFLDTRAHRLFFSFQNQLSGYLLRKFKNSSGWQKLWVVFTNFCLFFYKTHRVGVLHRARGGLCPWHCRTARPAHCALTEPPRF